MARVLIVGCGGRGRALGRELLRSGYQVRGTSRTAEGRAAIEADGLEPVAADPDRLATLLPALAGTTAVCWLLGSAEGSHEQLAALHGPRWATLLERLVDSPCRGAVYEAAGSVSPKLLDRGAEEARLAAATHAMPVRVAWTEPDEREAWLAAMAAAVESAISGR